MRVQRQNMVTLDGVEVPRMVGETVAWLRTRANKVEGLFRARCNMARVNSIRQLYERDDPEPLLDCNDPHVVAGVLKLYLASLPEPLLSFELCKSFLAASVITNRNRRLSTLRALLHSLEEGALSMMLVLLPLLHGVCKSSRKADTAAQLAAMFSPLFIRNKDARVYGIVEDVKRADSVVEEMICECAYLLTNEPISKASAKAGTSSLEAASGSGPASGSSSGSGLGSSSGSGSGSGSLDAGAQSSKAAQLRSTSQRASSSLHPLSPDRAAGKSQHTQYSAEECHAFDETLISSVDMLFEGTPSFDLEVDRILGGSLGHMYVRPLREMSKDELQAEKSAVKRKLRAYDAYFSQRFGRKPERGDKEHLRRLYIRYYKLKCYVTQGKGEKETSHDAGRVPLAEKSGNIPFSNHSKVEAPIASERFDMYAW